MSRLVFLLILLATVGVAAVLFQVKYEVQALERELAEVNDQIVEDREAVRVLKSEWSYLNRPERIARLARQHLDLGPVELAQVADVQQLPPRPEDFGYAQARQDGVPPEPRDRPSTPVGWEPELKPSSPQQPNVPERPSKPAVQQAAATPASPAPEARGPDSIEDIISRLSETDHAAGGSAGEVNPVTGQPLPVSATLGGGAQ